MQSLDAAGPAATPQGPTMVRAVSRWQIVGLSINDVIGSGIYLLPAAAAALLGAASLWAVLLAGLAVSLLVLCYAEASSHFDAPGGNYLYAREAFGRFVGFEIGWMTWLTRVSSAAALANGVALAVAQLWPAAGGGWANAVVVTLALGVVTWLNLIGVRSGARTAVALVLAKLLPLLAFMVVGLFFMDWSRVSGARIPSAQGLGQAALLLLFAYAGFENTPAAAGEYRNPRRDVPFALLSMIVLVTLLYVVVQLVALGTLPGLAESGSPLAEAAGLMVGPAGVWLLTVGAAVSILGTLSNTVLFAPRYLYALSADGFGPAALMRIHPRWRTPAVAIVLTSGVGLALALSGSFVQLALLSIIARLFTYISTAAAVPVLRRRHGHRPGALRLPGGAAIPVAAIALSLGLLASASWANLLAGAVALGVGGLVYLWRRDRPAPGAAVVPVTAQPEDSSRPMR